MRRFVASLLVVVILLFPAAVSAAGPSPTPNGFCGALNMLAATGEFGHAQGVGVQDAKAGMFHAMAVDNENGNAGMWRAVAVTGCRS